ncbi:MAG: DUF2164 domain-containing protein [Kangiellaceae bacterium]|jgi:uncharacterized protein (DUF2164 family)
MSSIKFDTQKKTLLIQKLQAYFMKELDFELGQFDSEFLLDFISEELGAYYYNQGLSDAQNLLQQKIEIITEGFYELEKVTI